MVNQMVASRHVAQTTSLLLNALGQSRLYLLIRKTKSVHLSPAGPPCFFLIFVSFRTSENAGLVYCHEPRATPVAAMTCRDEEME